MLIPAIFGALLAGSAWAGAHVSRADGIVEIRRAAGAAWAPAKALDLLDAGDRVRTGLEAAAGLAFDDGTALQLGPEASLVVEESSERPSRVRLDLGLLRVWVPPRRAGTPAAGPGDPAAGPGDPAAGPGDPASRAVRFELRTPTALGRVRGTEFGGGAQRTAQAPSRSPRTAPEENAWALEARVLAGGRTLIDLFQGELSVEDTFGNQTMVKPNERLQIDVRGLQAPERRRSRREAASAGLRALVRAEAAYDEAQERARRAAAREARLEELQLGKALVDVSGSRVRVEEYVSRPRSDQFKLVVLNQRSRQRDWFFYQGTFNRSLPADLSVALAQLSGCVDRACDWYLTEYVTGRSNLMDLVVERGVNTLGGQVDVNFNGDNGDNVSRLFDSTTDSFLDVAGRSVFQTIFNRFGFYVNGRLKYGFSGANTITSNSDRAPSANTDPLTGAPATAANAWLDPADGQLAIRTPVTTFPNADNVQKQIYESYSDGSWLQWDNYSIDTEGKVAGASDFGGTAGTAYKRGTLDWGYEQVVTSSHFGGRKIDLVVEPRFLLQAGLLQ